MTDDTKPVVPVVAPVTAGSGVAVSNPTLPTSPRVKEFDIPKFVLDNYASLIDLIIATKSMDDKERQYWFHILPIMTKPQVDKLVTILNTEKQKLAQIDEQYGKKMKDATDKRAEFYEEEAHKQKMQKLKQDEVTFETEDKATEEELLKKLSDV